MRDVSMHLSTSSSHFTTPYTLTPSLHILPLPSIHLYIHIYIYSASLIKGISSPQTPFVTRISFSSTPLHSHLLSTLRLVTNPLCLLLSLSPSSSLSLSAELSLRVGASLHTLPLPPQITAVAPMRPSAPVGRPHARRLFVVMQGRRGEEMVIPHATRFHLATHPHTSHLTCLRSVISLTPLLCSSTHSSSSPLLLLLLIGSSSTPLLHPPPPPHSHTLSRRGGYQHTPEETRLVASDGRTPCNMLGVEMLLYGPIDLFSIIPNTSALLSLPLPLSLFLLICPPSFNEHHEAMKTEHQYIPLF